MLAEGCSTENLIREDRNSHTFYGSPTLIPLCDFRNIK